MTNPRSLAFLGALASLATLAFACKSQYEINAQAFCEANPNACRGSAGAAGDENGTGGVGGGENGTGGVGGTAGIGGDGGTSGIGGGGTGGSGCEAGKIACGADCRDIAGNDPDNCGACGRSCLGAACNAGVCDVQLVVTSEVAPYALAKNETSLFWVSPARKQDGSVSPRVRGIAKEPLGNVTPQNLINNTFVRARSLAFFEGFLYWGTLGNDPSDTTGQRLARGTPDALDGTPVANNQRNIQHVVVSPPNQIYWTALSDAAVRAAPLEGGGIDLTILGQSAVGWIAIDEQKLPYWISTDTKEVRRQTLEGPAPPNDFELVTAANAPISVELGNGRVYWADRTPGAIRSAPKGELSNVAIDFAGRGPVEGFALEGTALIVITLATDELGNKLLQVWRKNEGREPLLLGQVAVKSPNTYGNGNPFGAAHVLLDGDFVYFADVGTIEGVSNGVSLSSGDGSLYRVAK